MSDRLTEWNAGQDWRTRKMDSDRQPSQWPVSRGWRAIVFAAVVIAIGSFVVLVAGCQDEFYQRQLCGGAAAVATCFVCQKNPATTSNGKLCEECQHDIDVGGRHKRSRPVCASLGWKSKATTHLKENR